MAYLDQLQGLDVRYVSHFTVSNTGSLWTEFFGPFRSDINISLAPDTLQSARTFSVALAWAKRSGLPLSTLVANHYGAFWGLDLRTGNFENVP